MYWCLITNFSFDKYSFSQQNKISAMSNKSNSLDTEPVFMSLEEAEAIIYGQEFFNVKRTYSCAKRNGDIAVQEAERNLNLSTKFHFDLKTVIGLNF